MESHDAPSTATWQQFLHHGLHERDPVPPADQLIQLLFVLTKHKLADGKPVFGFVQRGFVTDVHLDFNE